MRSILLFCLLICLCAAAQQAPIPVATALPGSPFAIKKSWPIGGAGSWDYLTTDPSSQRLYIAHGRVVQVVDIDSGTVVQEIPGFREAHQIALDDTGTYGYVSDGLADAVDVFNRSSLRVEASIPIRCSPRSIAFEPRSKLVFAVCGAYGMAPRAPQPGQKPAQPAFNGLSRVAVIDAEKNSVLADILSPGDFRFVQADGDGHVYISVGPARFQSAQCRPSSWCSVPQQIARLDAVGIATEADRQVGARSDQDAAGPAQFDWSESRPPDSLLRYLPLDGSCANPQGLAVDGRDHRLFVACDNQQFVVLDSTSGNVVASLTTGPGDDALAYDRDRGLIFIASGSGYGSLTIVQQDQTTDSYAVIQNLPTLERARTLALDPSSGNVYLATDFQGADVSKPGGIGTLRVVPIPGSFQVLDVGR